jgi:hypothetical protein
MKIEIIRGLVKKLCLVLSLVTISLVSMGSVYAEGIETKDIVKGVNKAAPVIGLGCAAATGDAKDVAKAGVHVATGAVAVPAAVATASALGVTASTGTAIAGLSGAAATSATLAAVGAPVCGVLGIAASPAVVGGVVVGGAALLVGYGINCLLFE